jgi:heme oxygenase
MAPANEKQQAHQLVEQLDAGQLDAVVRLLQVMLDPLARTLANAPFDDEPVGEDEARQATAAHDALARGEAIPNEDILADFGLSNEDFERMGRTPIDPHTPGQ